LSRHVSLSQKRKKTELVERTKLQIELLERVALLLSIWLDGALRKRCLTSSINGSRRRQWDFTK
jgi:hypothetical protein